MKYLKTFESFQETDNPHGGEFNYGNLSQTDIDKVKIFIEDLKEMAKENNINLKLVKTPGVKYVGSDFMVNGYFDEVSRTLACSLGKDISQWLPVLLHEGSHMDQFLEQVPSWTNNVGLDKTDEWLSGEDVDLELISKEIKTSIDVELDCEKRTVEKIKKYNLQNIIDVKEYIQKSNAYILFYLWMKKNRKWYTIGKEPYNIPQVVSSMPSNFDINYTQLDPKIEEIFDKYLN